MQKVAAYLLERVDEMNWPEARSSEADELKSRVMDWLRSKGATDLGSQGSYLSEDGSKATYEIEDAVDGPRGWWILRLHELAASGRRFDASVSITSGARSVFAYATLEVGSGETLVKPFDVDPHCPKIIRHLLKRPGRWFHGFTEVRQLRRVDGFDDGQSLVAEIKHPHRTIPFIVVTEIGGQLALPEIDRDLSFDLAGIANVFVLDPDAAWALTDGLGDSLSCFRGAVRLYWPRLTIADDPYRHPLWTADRLRSVDTNLKATVLRFRRQMRSLIMNAAALSVVRPIEIDDIRSAAAHRTFADLRDRAKSLQEYVELADLYASDNDELRGANARLHAEIEGLQSQVVKLEGDRQALLWQLKAKGGGEVAGDVIEPDTPAEPAHDSPSAGETRYYKKRYSAGDHDIMIRVNDCGHTSWQEAHAADKARKGILKLEDRDDWKTLQHCGKCQGGGQWKVRW